MSEQRKINLRVRRTDPQTSFEAAASVINKVRDSQLAVLMVLARLGRATDTELVEHYQKTMLELDFVPLQSASGIRTRRKELVERGLVEDTGKRDILPSGRKSIVWKVTD